MTVIRGQHLTTFDIAPDGSSFSIHVTDEQAEPATLVLPADCLNELIITLPEILKRSLRLRFQDDSMRLVYPVGSWDVEGSMVPGSVIVTLRAPDGFGVSFALPAFDLLRMASMGAEACPAASAVIGN